MTRSKFAYHGVTELGAHEKTALGLVFAVNALARDVVLAYGQTKAP